MWASSLWETQSLWNLPLSLSQNGYVSRQHQPQEWSEAHDLGPASTCFLAPPWEVWKASWTDESLEGEGVFISWLLVPHLPYLCCLHPCAQPGCCGSVHRYRRCSIHTCCTPCLWLREDWGQKASHPLEWISTWDCTNVYVLVPTLDKMNQCLDLEQAIFHILFALKYQASFLTHFLPGSKPKAQTPSRLAFRTWW